MQQKNWFHPNVVVYSDIKKIFLNKDRSINI